MTTQHSTEYGEEYVFLTKGQAVIVYATELDGWCYGRVPDRQREGWFPASHSALQTVHDRPGDKTWTLQ